MRQLGAALARERADRVAQRARPRQLELRRRDLVLARQQQERRQGRRARRSRRARRPARSPSECAGSSSPATASAEFVVPRSMPRILHAGSSTSAGAITVRSTPSASAGQLGVYHAPAVMAKRAAERRLALRLADQPDLRRDRSPSARRPSPPPRPASPARTTGADRAPCDSRDGPRARPRRCRRRDAPSTESRRKSTSRPSRWSSASSASAPSRCCCAPRRVCGFSDDLLDHALDSTFSVGLSAAGSGAGQQLRAPPRQRLAEQDPEEAEEREPGVHRARI